VKRRNYFNKLIDTLLGILVTYILLSSIACSSEKIVFIADPVFANLFLTDKEVKKEIRDIAASYNYSLAFLEYDSITTTVEGSTVKIDPKLEKALMNGSQIILSPMLSNLVVSGDAAEGNAEDTVISIIREIPVEQIVFWVSETDALDDNYYRIIRDSTQGWYDAGLFGGTYTSKGTAFIYIGNDKKGESNALSFSQGAGDSGAEASEIFTISKTASVTELREILDSASVSIADKSVLGVYAGAKTADIIKLARELGLFVICEYAEWIIEKNDESFGTITENLPVVFERVFEKIQKISIPENNENENDAVTENVMIIPGQMDFIVIQ